MADDNMQAHDDGVDLKRLEQWIFDELHRMDQKRLKLFRDVAERDIHAVLWILLGADYFTVANAYGNQVVIDYCYSVFYEFGNYKRRTTADAPVRITTLKLPWYRLILRLDENDGEGRRVVPWHTLNKNIAKLDQLTHLEIGDCNITQHLEALQHLETLIIDNIAYPENPEHSPCALHTLAKLTISGCHQLLSWISKSTFPSLKSLNVTFHSGIATDSFTIYDRCPCTFHSLVELTVSGCPQLLSWVAKSTFPYLKSLTIVFPSESVVNSSTTYKTIAELFKANKMLQTIQHLCIAEDRGPASCSVPFVLETLPAILPNLKELSLKCHKWGTVYKLMAKRLENGDYDPSLLAPWSRNLTKLEGLRDFGCITSRIVDRTASILKVFKSLVSLPNLEWFVKLKKMKVVYYIFINSLGLHLLMPKTEPVALSIWPFAIDRALHGRAKSLQEIDVPRRINYTAVYQMLRSNLEIFGSAGEKNLEGQLKKRKAVGLEMSCPPRARMVDE